MDNNDQDLELHYWAVAFVDLLGQKEAMAKVRYIPEDDDQEARAQLIKVLKESFGAIMAFQDGFSLFMDNYRTSFEPNSEWSEEQQKIVNRLTACQIKSQRFSDGIVIFTSLKPSDCHMPLRALFGMMAACGSMLLVNLAAELPFRAGVDVGLGIEMRENELYGPVVAQAYDLESRVAQYPRVAVGPGLVNYLMCARGIEGSDVASQVEKGLAESCLEMIIPDIDGVPIVHYLGEAFGANTSMWEMTGSAEVYEKAYKFATDQWQRFREERNTKLAVRYALLRGYLDTCPQQFARSLDSEAQG